LQKGFSIPKPRSAKDSRKNKSTILGVAAPVWQGAKTQESAAADSELSQRRQAGCIGG
jgi:hypothetical protein